MTRLFAAVAGNQLGACTLCKERISVGYRLILHVYNMRMLLFQTVFCIFSLSWGITSMRRISFLCRIREEPIQSSPSKKCYRFGGRFRCFILTQVSLKGDTDMQGISNREDGQTAKKQSKNVELFLNCKHVILRAA